MSEATMSVQALHTTIREKVAHFRQVVLDSVTADDVVVVFRKLIDSAIEGSAQSAKLVMAYLFGRPGPHGPFPSPGVSSFVSLVSFVVRNPG
jgi:hypothetical protein